MKKNYLSPEIDVMFVTMESNILSNGENVSINTTYSSMDEDDFWD